MIHVEGLIKTWRVPVRDPGLGGAFKSLFTRRAKIVQALDGVSFDVAKGEIVAYIGPNGAGKSTTIKTMSGVLIPDSGTCVIDGRVPWKERVEHVRRIGVVFGQRSQLWQDVPVEDSFDLLRDIYRVPTDRHRRMRNELTDELGLGKLLNRKARSLSLGERMRCDIAAALLHEPDLLFLDEPTIGLDAVSKLAVRDFVLRVNRERGVTIVLTTHDMHDVEAVTDRVILIGSGRVLLDGSFSAMKEKYAVQDDSGRDPSLEQVMARVYGELGV